jgi:SepF-like predicted cell division protein (DUF552 family)
MVFEKLKRALSGSSSGGDEYVEIDLSGDKAPDNKVFVKLYTLRQYDDVNEILNALREGFTIVVIDIKPLRQKDPIELKRAVSKVKKTTDALEGTIAGFGENILIATPAFAKIHKDAPKPTKEKKDMEFY